MNKSLLGCLGVLVVGALILGAWVVGKYNALVPLSQSVDAQWAQVQNVYQRRADLIPNLVKTVEGAANFEKSTLTDIVNARASVGQVKIDPSKAPDPETLAKFQAAQDGLSSALSRLLVVVEKYPELKSNQNFLNLQSQLEGTENRISVERGKFNDTVKAFNTAVQVFPTNVIAGMFGYRVKSYFSAKAGAENPPPVNFQFGQPTPAPTGK
ncbi:LemA family protein [Verrucomicrobia bacterium SCGC AG-212-E04]|nr:LemA family protein [Verrucomicrobia bacterium SCGC AG-212-E04]